MTFLDKFIKPKFPTIEHGSYRWMIVGDKFNIQIFDNPRMEGEPVGTLGLDRNAVKVLTEAIIKYNKMFQ